MPKRIPLEVWKGNTLQRVWAFKDAAGAPVDITGWEAVVVIEWPAAVGIAAGEIRKTTDENGGLAVDVQAGSFALALTPAETRQIPTGTSAKYEFEIRYQGTEATPFYGEVKVSEWANDDA